MRIIKSILLFLMTFLFFACAHRVNPESQMQNKRIALTERVDLELKIYRENPVSGKILERPQNKYDRASILKGLQNSGLNLNCESPNKVPVDVSIVEKSNYRFLSFKTIWLVASTATFYLIPYYDTTEVTIKLSFRGTSKVIELPFKVEHINSAANLFRKKNEHDGNKEFVDKKNSIFLDKTIEAFQLAGQN